MRVMFFLFLCSFLFASEPILQGGPFPQEQMYAQREQIASMMAREMSKDLPHKIDAYTTLDSITNSGATLLYRFRIKNDAKSDEAIKRDDYHRMKRAVFNGVCHQSRKLLEADIDTTYIYSSARTGNELFRFEVNKERCKNILKR